MRIKKIFIFLLLTVFFCSFNTDKVFAETEKESVKEEVCQTYPVKPEIYLKQDNNNGRITTIKKEIEISGYITNCKQNGITEVYFNNEPVPLQEDGSFSKIIEISLFESSNYDIVIKDASGNIIDCRILSVALSPLLFLLCFFDIVIALCFITDGVKRNSLYGNGEGTKYIVSGIFIFIFIFLIAFVIYFSPAV